MSNAGPERRRAPRHHDVKAHGIVSARVRPGHQAELIDVSAGGVLLETSHRLLPGSHVELHVETQSRRDNIRGRVLRCAVVGVRASGVSYRGAIGFDRHLPWFIEPDGYVVPTTESRAGRPPRADVTQQVV